MRGWRGNLKVRNLKICDAHYMLEWMHDLNVIQWMQIDFANKSFEDCKNFIKTSIKNEEKNIHRAIVNDDDIYMGTVSLKHITSDEAELAIVLRSVAMGKGFSGYAMEEIIKIGFEKRFLKRIYWCVSKKNERAINFYDKSGYHRVSSTLLNPMSDYTPEQIGSYIWYMVEKD